MGEKVKFEQDFTVFIFNCFNWEAYE